MTIGVHRMEFSASLSGHPFGDEDESRIKAIIGRHLWGKATKWNDYFFRSYRRGAKENEVFGSERLRADIDRQYVSLALKIQDKLSKGERLRLNMWW